MIRCPNCSQTLSPVPPREWECECGKRDLDSQGILVFAPEYEENFSDHTEASIEILASNAEKHFWLIARRRWVAQSVMSHLAESDNFLDVGVGGCDIPAVLREKGLSVSLGDIQTRSLHIGASIGFKDLFQFDLYRPVFEEHFRGVGVFDVLEHLDDDEAAVRNLLKMAIPGGYIFATVPAFQFLWNNRDVMERHKRRYSRKQFSNLFREQGAEIISCRYIFSSILPLLFLRAIHSKIFPKAHFSIEEQQEQFKIHPLLNCLLKSMTLLESRILGTKSLPFGGSLLLVARKPT